MLDAHRVKSLSALGSVAQLVELVSNRPQICLVGQQHRIPSLRWRDGG